MAAKKASGRPLVEREPNRRPGAVRQNLVFGEARERNDAAAFSAKPSTPVGRGDVADIGDARICLLARNYVAESKGGLAVEGPQNSQFEVLFSKSFVDFIFLNRP